MKVKIFELCQKIFPEWASLSIKDFNFDDPKGFSSFTMGIRAKKNVQPDAVLYRHLEGKKNAILDFQQEKEIFLTLGAHKIAAPCLYYDDSCRIEYFYHGSTLNARDLFDPDNLRKIANELYRFHQISPPSIPQKIFFNLLHDKWGDIAKYVIEDQFEVFPANEQKMCKELREIYNPCTFEKVKSILPDSELSFCHNDTYHGNIMKLDSGEIKLLDFEFSCLNYKTYDFANLFAETVMQHQLPEYPYFKIVEPEFGDHEIATLINFYLDNAQFKNQKQRDVEFKKLFFETKIMLILSDYKYAMAAITLAMNPIQKIRFIPYAFQRFNKFLEAYERITESKS